MSEQRLHDRLKALTDSYFRQLPDKFAQADRLWKEILSRGEWGAQARELHRLLHSLAGSGATFGAQELSACARDFEHHLQDCVQQAPPINADEAGRMELHLQQLASCIDREVRQYSARS
ncbi:MAG: Hpt domain-containing protein [Pseudomonadota bacterium]